MAAYRIPTWRDRVTVNGTTYQASNGLFTPLNDADAAEMRKLGGWADTSVGGLVEWVTDDAGTPQGFTAPTGSKYLAWVDIDFPIVIRTTGAGIPTMETLKGNVTAPQWVVGDFNVCEGQELIHSWAQGTEIFWHVHIVTNGSDNEARYLKWEIEWVWANIGGALSDTVTTTSADLLIPANTPDRTMLIQSIGSTTIAARIGGHVFARLKRVASSGSAPTANPFCGMLQLHVLCDTLGSNSISAK